MGWSDEKESLEEWRERKGKQGKIPESWWRIPKVGTSKERTGYPTQKPLKRLKRIIKACSNEGDIVLDPFCGCATTCVATETLGRHWVGIDISEKAYELVVSRLRREAQKKILPFFKTGRSYIEPTFRPTGREKDHPI